MGRVREKKTAGEKKERWANFTAADVEHLLEIVYKREYVDIILSKTSDAASKKQEGDAGKAVTVEFNSQRDVSEFIFP